MVTTKQNKHEEQSKYFYFYMNTNELKLVGKSSFKKGDYPIICDGNNKIKLVSSQMIISKKKFKYLFKECEHFKAESLFSDIKNSVGAIRTIMEVLININAKIEKCKNVMADITYEYVLEVFSLLLKVYKICEKGVDFVVITTLLIDFYLLLKRKSNVAIFKGEMLEEVCLASMSMFLPKEFFEIIKRINLFTSSKMSEDFKGVHRLLQVFFDGVLWVLNLFPQSKILTVVKEFCTKLSKSSIHGIMREITQEVQQNSKYVSDNLLKINYREKIKDLYLKINKEEMADWARKSPAVSHIYLEFTNLYKRVKAFEECSRVEPIGIVFQGPPACGKSHAMNGLLQALPYSRYCHQVKDVNDGKDFYDMYNNETIFYMDDVGQQGISQWRTFINMISEVKYPLDCAQAEKKDTKFFNSEIILATTNEFMHLSGLTKQDCIRELPALWRRCQVVDFKNAKFVNGNYQGFVNWKYYDLDAKEFRVGFPVYMSEEILKLGGSSTFTFVGQDPIEFLIWLAKNVKILKFINERRHVSGILTESQKLLIDEKSDFKSEGLMSWIQNQEEDDSLVSNLDQILHDMRIDYMHETLDNSQENGNEFLEWRFSEIFGNDNVTNETWTQFYFKILKDQIMWMFGKCKYLCEIIKEVVLIPEVLAHIITLCLVFGIALALEWWSCKKATPVSGCYSGESSKLRNENLSTKDAAILKNLKNITIMTENNRKIYGVGLFSGHYFITTNHSLPMDSKVVTVYQDNNKSHVLYDKVKINVIFRDFENDVAICEMPKNMQAVLKNMAHFFLNSAKDDSLYNLLTPKGIFDSCKSVNISEKSPIVYKIPIPFEHNDSNAVVGENFQYAYHGQGVCGSVIVNNTSIVGMHVAGAETLGLGLAIKWPESLRKDIGTILLSDKMFGSPFTLSNKVIEDSSILKLEEKLPVSVATNSSLGTTPLYGIYPVTRFPANLMKYGKCTVKDIAKKSFGHTVDPSFKEIEFGKSVCRFFLKGSEYRTLDEKEIVCGNGKLAGLNKKSSNGFKCLKLKTDYINYEEGCFKDFFREEMDALELGIQQGNPDYSKFVWVESLKDELRSEEKEGVPRSFRVGTLHHQVLMKKYFGFLVEHLMSRRQENNIMVGINPIKEWPKMYEKLLSSKGIFAGDIAKWDGSMNSVVQDAIKDVILEFIPEDTKFISDFVLENAIRSLVAVQDDLYITTHSMPSGHYLTAILNSLVNRFYSAMWYIRLIPNGNVVDFLESVTDYVYGDDKLLGIFKYEKILNAISMKEFFESMGMGFTDSEKKPIMVPFQTIDEVTFLKRSFRYHDILQQIVCPLELRTLQSGLSFYDRSKDLTTVLRDKLSTYQREIYLWPHRDFLLKEFLQRLADFCMPVDVLSSDYLYSLYTDDEDFAFSLLWGGSKYL
jgi:hypothetical protein